MKAIYKDLDKASAKSDAEKAQEQLDKPPYGLTMEEYKRYFPKEYEKRYGEKSEYRKRQKEKNKLKDAKDEVRKEMLDELYNYQPKKKKGFGSEGFGEEKFGEEKFGEDKKTGFGSKKFGEE
jgi:alpha-galactosidase/6-phospho-beta-glucosidase family protein